MLCGIKAADSLTLGSLSPLARHHLHTLGEFAGAAEGIAAVLLTHQLTDALVEQEVHRHLGGGHLTCIGVAALGTVGLEGTVAQHVDVFSSTCLVTLLDTGLGTEQIGIGQTHQRPVLHQRPSEVVGLVIATPLGRMRIHHGEGILDSPIAAVTCLHGHIGSAFSTIIYAIEEAVNLLYRNILAHIGLVAVEDTADVVVRVADVTLFPYTILHVVAQTQTTVTTTADRVGILHEVGQLVEGSHPVTALLRRIDRTTRNVAAVLHLEHPDTLLVTLRTALVAPTEHIAVVVAGIGEELTVALRDQFVVTTVDGSRHGSLCLGILTHAVESLTGQHPGTVLVDTVLRLGLVHLRQVGHGVVQVSRNHAVHLCHGVTSEVGARLGLALGDQGHRSPEGHQHVVGIGPEELCLALGGRIHTLGIDDDVCAVDDTIERCPKFADTTVL